MIKEKNPAITGTANEANRLKATHDACALFLNKFNTEQTDYHLWGIFAMAIASDEYENLLPNQKQDMAFFFRELNLLFRNLNK